MGTPTIRALLIMASSLQEVLKLLISIYDDMSSLNINSQPQLKLEGTYMQQVFFYLLFVSWA